MTGRRDGYLIALVAAVLVLLGSVAAVLVFVASGRLSPAGSPVPASTSGGWQQGPGSGMMGDG
ncbi:MAG: hypothetical protein WCF36_05630 [Candidatus Nanopelagicales bacterium]